MHWKQAASCKHTNHLQIVLQIMAASEKEQSRKQWPSLALADCQSRQALPKVVNHAPTFLHDVQLQQLPDVLEETGLLVCLLLLLLLIYLLLLLSLFLWFYIICTFECDLKSSITDINSE